MFPNRDRLLNVIAISFGLVCGSLTIAAEPNPKSGPIAKPPAITVRCAVIGGMTDTGLWDAVTERFTRATGIKTAVVATGPKNEIAGPFARHEADLITMHASDEILNLVADGYGVDPQPWARNDLLLVGPASDPAHIKGMTDAVAALKKIIASKAKFLVHQSVGTNDVLHELLDADDLELDPDHTVAMATDRNRELLQHAAKENAYTIVGRIPFLNGKIANAGLVIMVQGDPRMRRPYLVVVRSTTKSDDPQVQAARRLAAYLRSPETQQFLKEFGRGDLDDRPLFFPVVIPPQSQVTAH
jgi:tungstate transport system substrate-binding protein